jgi:hypothetical protein
VEGRDLSFLSPIPMAYSVIPAHGCHSVMNHHGRKSECIVYAPRPPRLTELWTTLSGRANTSLPRLESHMIGMTMLARFLGRAKRCPHLRIDELGRCDTCFHWYPDWNPPDRGSIKRASELSILAIEEPKTGAVKVSP